MRSFKASKITRPLLANKAWGLPACKGMSSQSSGGHAKKKTNADSHVASWQPTYHSKKLDFATCDPDSLGSGAPAKVHNIIQGEWIQGTDGAYEVIPDPIDGRPFIEVSEIQQNSLNAFVRSLNSCPKYGMHNPLLNVDRYLLYGEISLKAANMLRDPEVERFFARLIQRVSPKSYAQARGEVVVTRKFLENFSGDQVRFLARSFSVPGDHTGQQSQGYRWPYGPVALITPFNFPLEIPVLQTMGALYMGNRPLLKVDSKVSIVMDQFIRLLHSCGMPMGDLDFINCHGPMMQTLLEKARPRTTLFTGSSKVANILAERLEGRVKVESAGFGWKVLGPDVPSDPAVIDYVAHVCDQDAYASSGQKCSAQSILFVHKNWSKTNLLDKLQQLASQRRLDDLTVGPTLSVTTQTFTNHVEALKKIPGARVLFGGVEINEGKHNIPRQYGAMKPTAVMVPLSSLTASKENLQLATTEVFAPFQVVTEFDDSDIPAVLDVLEFVQNHLTAAIVSNDVSFQRLFQGRSVNGTTYVGMRARTTGAPQNHWFGPAGDPRAAGIGTKEAIHVTWSCHREFIHDNDLSFIKNWKLPART
ncbi:hypothetical protein GUITHDRAFT_94019 [Guillardia theta CCMP2712]|uniref:Aldehyde dehydrogenase domain-containing protein n=1 Tax=Guillardia theta (strain CCMP2712) TaxID=905079 RepID=L1JFF5_GUITC|nr:hypothetical protein GUITHDRAFT_94019 [Guillardia theta CCMP2712]EKX47052.1 hypothetical protein GUITHDRAFT_94019 [Guillardia theta CCMP2712]|eukprot:XP_005834032.1 hypothetical protein GUITHDRAFT_94019 [Guillardia theta CCMP2712]